MLNLKIIKVYKPLPFPMFSILLSNYYLNIKIGQVKSLLHNGYPPIDVKK